MLAKGCKKRVLTRSQCPPSVYLLLRCLLFCRFSARRSHLLRVRVRVRVRVPTLTLTLARSVPVALASPALPARGGAVVAGSE